jgi:D-serine deaminase-like pyridoxal phosphate-dependent protein
VLPELNCHTRPEVQILEIDTVRGLDRSHDLYIFSKIQIHTTALSNSQAMWQPAVGATRDELETPCLVLDLDILEANIAKMKAYCGDNGVAWRPHAKVYKSTALAKKVVEAGAIGVTCAKLSEAEAMAAAGVIFPRIQSTIDPPPPTSASASAPSVRSVQG